MGCNYSKPYKNDPSTPNVIAAYQWDERECGFGSNKFLLADEPDSSKDKDNNKDEFTKVKAIIEPKLDAAVDIIMEYATRGCFCDSLDFGPAIDVINKEWAVEVNAELVGYACRYSVDAFAWKEWQYNGQSSRQASFLVLRISKVLDNQPTEAEAE
mmetsp:Transcript_34515/g.50097  ORF Transcript_34515/g.50097 Transcript_34515/m.50097 type:complete len:156 (-) Transcript_34515:543-1010(-)